MRNIKPYLSIIDFASCRILSFKKGLCLIVLLLSFSAKAQEPSFFERTFLGLGYLYQDKNYLQLNAEILVYYSNNNMMFLGASANFGWHSNKSIIIPELSTTIVFFEKLPTLSMTRLNVSPYYIAPEIGLNLIYTDVSLGYAIPFKSDALSAYPHNKGGFRLNLRLKVPLKYKNFIKIM